MKRLLAVFQLTVPEQRVIVLLLFAVVAVITWSAATRRHAAKQAQPELRAGAQPSPPR